MGQRRSQDSQIAMLTAPLLVMVLIVFTGGSTVSILARREHLAGYCNATVETYSMASEARRCVLVKSAVMC